jgi:hypothetical protein
MPVILGTQEAEIRSITVQSQPRQIVCKTHLEKKNHKKELVGWLKVYTLSSNTVPQQKTKSGVPHQILYQLNHNVLEIHPCTAKFGMTAYVHRRTSPRMFTAALLVIARTQNFPNIHRLNSYSVREHPVK